MSASDRDRGDDAGRTTVQTDVSQIDLADLQEGRFPTGGGAEYRVHITADAFETVRRHAASDTSVELCGVLAGTLLKDADGPFLLVEHAIAGKATRRTGSQVTFTHETWEQIHADMEASYPDKRIVGWYHTHPGFGIFLSEMDQFIQDNFFNLPHSVAFVYDPLNECRGLFVWRDGRSVRLRRYWLGGELCYDLEPETGAPEQALEVSTERSAEPQAMERRESVPIQDQEQARDGWGLEGRGGLSLTWLLAAVVLLGAAFWAGSMVGRMTGSGGRAELEMMENLIRAGLFRDGLQPELNQVSQRLSRAHSALSALDLAAAGVGDGEAAARQVHQIQDSVRQAHRDLARISKVYTEADRLARRLGAVPTLTDDVARLKRETLELRTYLAALLSLEAEEIEGGTAAMDADQRAVVARQLKGLALQIAPELQMELLRQAAEDERLGGSADPEAGD